MFLIFIRLHKEVAELTRDQYWKLVQQLEADLYSA
jgi:hypothetical protein